MAADSAQASFDSIIQAGRRRKQHESLASEIFGKGRRSSTPGLSTGRRSTPPALAGRITKPGQQRSTSAWSTSTSRSKLPSTLSPFSSATKPSSGLKGAAKGRLQANTDTKINGSALPRNGQGFSIRGTAGPYVVVGSNFAPGTSGEDLETAISAIVGPMDLCQIVAERPTVIAEMVFSDRKRADMTINTFNNQKADGRLLHVHMKQGGPTVLHSPLSAQPVGRQAGTEVIPRAMRSNGSRAEPEYRDGRYGFRNPDLEDVEMQVDSEPSASGQNVDRSSRRANARNGADNDRFDTRYRSSENRGAERDTYQNNYSDRANNYSNRGTNRDRASDRDKYDSRSGSDQPYGQSGNHYPSDARDQRRLYSDDIYPERRGRGFR